MNVITKPAVLERFERVTESIYGHFATIDDPSRWIPPLKSGGHHRRYLWTDAFGVVNFLTLNANYTQLGGGLRIGKMDESGPNGDGQYHHYLTLWMFALNRVSLATGDLSYNNQAIALAKAIHPRFFVNRQSTRLRMVWKMSMDLSTALRPSEGNLDPIHGYVIFQLLQATARQFDIAGTGVLDEEISDYKRVMKRRGRHIVSSDLLDLGMALHMECPLVLRKRALG
jgi:hypothetical protein